MARSLAGAAAGPGGGQAGHRPFLDEGGLVLGHQREDAEDELAVGGGGVNDAVGQRLDADAAGFQAGDDLDEVGEVVDSTLGSDLRQAAAALEYLPGDPADSWPASIPDAANAMAAVARSQTRGRRPAERRKIVEAFGEMFRPAAKGRLSVGGARGAPGLVTSRRVGSRSAPGPAKMLRDPVCLRTAGVL
jgi:hypothetical protein